MKIGRYLKPLCVLGLAAMLGCGDSSNDTIANVAGGGGGQAQIAPFAVYTMTNAPISNSIREYIRQADGTLVFRDEFTTGGNGDGTDLSGAGSSLDFQSSTNRFYAVNAGSNTLSAMVLGTNGGIQVLSTVTSNGARPISVTHFNDLVYVLNYGDAVTPANISGYRMVGAQLVPIQGSTQTLSAPNPDPVQIGFHPTGTVLVVTERGTDNIVTFVVDSNGVAQPGVSQGSNGLDPSGITFNPNGLLVVAEANAGVVGGGSSSVYDVAVNGTLVDKSISVGNNQTGTAQGRVYTNAPYVFFCNTLSNTVSTYTLDGAGNLALLDGAAGFTGTAPTELGVSADNQYVYTLNQASDTLSTFRINADGSLTDLNFNPAIPATAVGLVVR